MMSEWNVRKFYRYENQEKQKVVAMVDNILLARITE